MIAVEEVAKLRERVATERPVPEWVTRLGLAGLAVERHNRTVDCLSNCGSCYLESCACYYGPGVCGDVCVDPTCGRDCWDTCFITNCVC